MRDGGFGGSAARAVVLGVYSLPAQIRGPLSGHCRRDGDCGLGDPLETKADIAPWHVNYAACQKD